MLFIIHDILFPGPTSIVVAQQTHRRKWNILHLPEIWTEPLPLRGKIKKLLLIWMGKLIYSFIALC